MVLVLLLGLDALCVSSQVSFVLISQKEITKDVDLLERSYLMEAESI